MPQTVPDLPLPHILYVLLKSSSSMKPSMVLPLLGEVFAAPLSRVVLSGSWNCLSYIRASGVHFISPFSWQITMFLKVLSWSHRYPPHCLYYLGHSQQIVIEGMKEWRSTASQNVGNCTLSEPPPRKGVHTKLLTGESVRNTEKRKPPKVPIGREWQSPRVISMVPSPAHSLGSSSCFCYQGWVLLVEFAQENFAIFQHS